MKVWVNSRAHQLYTELSVQTVVPKLAPELVESYSMTHEDGSLNAVLEDLDGDSLSAANKELLDRVIAKRATRISRHDADYAELTTNIAQICLKPRTHVSLCSSYFTNVVLHVFLDSVVEVSSVWPAGAIRYIEKRSRPLRARGSSIRYQCDFRLFHPTVVRSTVSTPHMLNAQTLTKSLVEL